MRDTVLEQYLAKMGFLRDDYLRAFQRIFHTRKKMKSGYTILSQPDFQNVRSTRFFPYIFSRTIEQQKRQIRKFRLPLLLFSRT